MIDPVSFGLGAALFLLAGIALAAILPRQIIDHPWLVLAVLLGVSGAAVAVVGQIRTS